MMSPTLLALGAAIGVYLLGLGASLAFVRGLDGPAASCADLCDRIKLAMWWPAFAALLVMIAIGTMLQIAAGRSR